MATIFSFAANEEQSAIGDITDESFDTSTMNSSAKEFLDAAIDDYNAHFKTNYSTDSNGFQNYYRDLAQRVKNQDIDLLIVVGMFLTNSTFCAMYSTRLTQTSDSGLQVKGVNLNARFNGPVFNRVLQVMNKTYGRTWLESNARTRDGRQTAEPSA